MKCLCGYEYDESFPTDYEGINKRITEIQEASLLGPIPEKYIKKLIEGNKPFIELQYVKRVNGYHYERFGWSDRSDYSILYACPKCGTLKIDISNLEE